MSAIPAWQLGEDGLVEVRIFSDGALVHRRVCDNTGEAAEVVEDWMGIDGFSYEITELPLLGP